MAGAPGVGDRVAIMALHRYFLWADRMRVHLDGVVSKITLPLDERTDEGMDAMIEFNRYASYWYAGLHVVIEGWGDLKLKDTAVDALLLSPNVALLKRYRNGVFHFQPKYFDQRFTNLGESPDSVAWVRSLRTEFSRWFLDYFKGAGQRRRRPHDRRHLRPQVERGG